MTTSEKYSKELTETAEKIALEEFDKKTDKHVFSADYNKRKADFLKSIEVNQHKQNKKQTKKIIAIAASFLIAIPSTAFAAKKLYEVMIKKDQYEINVSVEGQANPAKKDQHYKLKLGYLPADMKDRQNSNKYSYDHNENMGGFSFVLWKVDNKADFSRLYVENYEEVTFGDNQGVITTAVNVGREAGFDRHTYLLFEEEGYVLETYVGNDVPDEDLQKVLAGITLEKTGKDNATSFIDYDEYQQEFKDEPDQEEYKVIGLAKNSPQLFKIGDVVKPELLTAVGEEIRPRTLNYTVKKVEIKDTISGIERSNLNSDSWERLIKNEMADESGQLLPYERVTYYQGDGKTTVDDVIEKKQIRPKFVYVTVLLENTTDQPFEEIYMQNGVTLLREEENKWSYLSDEQFDEPSSYSMEVDYLSSHGEGKSFYQMPTIQPREKREIQIGFFVDEDHLDQMFLPLFYTGHSGEVENLGASDRWWVDIRQ